MGSAELTPDTALVLVGPMGAGKSSIGRRVAKALGAPFRDTDAMIVDSHGPIAEIFSSLGEPRFREIEHETVREALRLGGVIALGGGAVLHEGTQAAIRPHRVALLTVDEHVVAGRIGGRKRPLLNAGDPVAERIRIRDERMPVYRSVADAEFDTSAGPLKLVVDRIVAWTQGAESEETT